MASSGYYYNQYEYYRDEYNKYSEWLTQLNDIKKGFTKWEVTGGPGDVNSRVKNVYNRLSEAVEGCSTYDSNISMVEEQKEDSVSTDSNLSSAKSAIEGEINSVTTKKNDAKYYRDYYWEKYEQALREEEEEE